MRLALSQRTGRPLRAALEDGYQRRAKSVLRAPAKFSLEKMLGVKGSHTGIDLIEAMLPSEPEQAIGVEAEHIVVARHRFVEPEQHHSRIVLDRKSVRQIVADRDKVREVGVIRAMHRQDLSLPGTGPSLVVCSPAITHRAGTATPHTTSRPKP